MKEVEVKKKLRQKKPTAEETLERRRIIKKMVLEDGITNRQEIKRRLADQGIEVSILTIYNDFKHIVSVSPTELKEFELDLMKIWKRLILDMQDMIGKEKDFKKKAYLIKTLSTIMRDRHQVASSIALHGKPEDIKKRKDEEEEVQISIG